MKSAMLIDGREHELDEVRLTFYFSPEPRINLFCHSHDDPARAGIALNCISLVDCVRSVTDLQRKVILFGYRPKPGELNVADNKYNDLMESVLTRGAEVLELLGLRVEFGDIQDNMIDVKLNAVCFIGLPSKDNIIRVSAEFRAVIEEES